MPSPPYPAPNHTTSHSNSIRLVPRDSGGLPTSTIIAIAVACGCVAILVLSLFLWRLLVRFCRPNHAAPLPPVQPLAHHREQQLAAFTDRNVVTPASWNESSLHTAHYLQATSSDVSLLPSGTPKDSSLYAEDLATAESISTLPSPQSNNDDHLPPPPRMTFGSSSPSATGSESSSLRGVTPSDTYGNLVSPSESVPHSETTSSTFSATSSTHPLVGTAYSPTPSRSARSRSTVRGGGGYQQSRPTSMISYAGSYSSRASASARNSTFIRGAPHSMHSNVQIVLPTPLAPQLNPFDTGGGGGSGDSPSRRASVFVDRWVNAGGAGGGSDGNTSDTSTVPSSWNNSKRRSHRQSMPVALPSTQSSSPSTSTSPSPMPSRRTTQHAPPVPRIPSEYNMPPPPQQEMIELDSGGRGRSRSRAERPPSLQLSEKASEASLRAASEGGRTKHRTLKKQRHADGGS
ncbi:hypothetical protein EIP91_012291 [Steccherinum ochraceum]|uniref:Uncharacterized protein n=1 Tax=Steccherinum ochraceum TaxID=92696 RepID=A0A4V2MWT9_9APHY|nr:hypothetical protein EIP91_012291 [Steccherinum ochraceum]